MPFPISSGVLLRGMMASAIVLGGATACSRSDRTETGSTNNAGVPSDTAGSTSGVSSGTTATTGAVPATDTATTSGNAPTSTDTSPASAPSNAPRAVTAPPSAERKDTTAGNRATQRDTATPNVHLDSARVTHDSSETSLNTADTTASVETATAAPADDSQSDTAQAASADTAAAGYVAMARDTTTGADQVDTTAAAVADTSANADVAASTDTSANAGRVRPPEDSTEILGQVTTDTGATVAVADTMESERIRPPEDSTEMLGAVTSNDSVSSGETADEVAVSPGEAASDQATGENRTDEVGAAAVAGELTGADAVALLSRQGLRCTMVDPETNKEVRWDMASTPASLNPCGLGSMNLSKIWTGER